ncbi:uncharacterized protein Z520_07287 [Fonsecaea multimorphosa CBS 102226]|uniref:Uncharacterized protein n=1 Tax=Fonsecaea multimorphosa CBS 102226 TaxID=1442371 RepID=A0A0D2KKK8_9EURO|nr:uncharacterized protein Z520_07287 [Fonsecaea multimorphosa CBS 102226]KIX97173.1 hypothetical protein Z520_07287 [Fonsecaea multimorphosa CBS 102226]
MAQPPFFHIDHARKDIAALTVAVHGRVEDNGEGSCIKSGWLNFPEPEPEREHEHEHEHEHGSELMSDLEVKEEKIRRMCDGDGDGEKSCAATDDFPILLSAGEGVIIHYDLYTRAAKGADAAADRSPIYPWSHDNNNTHNTKTRGKKTVTVSMPTGQNQTHELDIVGGTYFAFVLKEWHSWGFLRFNVKCLVTISDLPSIQPDYSHRHQRRRRRPLMWIGVGTETETAATSHKGESSSSSAASATPSLVQLAYRVGGMHQGSKPAYWVRKDDGGVEMV